MAGRKVKSDRFRSRRVARLRAVQALFQMEASGQSIDEVLADFKEFGFGEGIDGIEYDDADTSFLRMLVEGAVDQQATVDKLTDRALAADWPIGRIDPTLRALFRSAGAELLSNATPLRVAISESVEVAKAFFPDGKQAGFVNGVLESMARWARPESFDAAGAKTRRAPSGPGGK